MSGRTTRTEIVPAGKLPGDQELDRHITRRQRIGVITRRAFLIAMVVAVITLATLLLTVINDSFGLVGVQSEVSEEEALGGRTLDELTAAELLAVLETNLSPAESRILNSEQPLADRNREGLAQAVRDEVLEEEIVETWPLFPSLTQREAFAAELAEDYPRAELRWYSWLDWRFITTPMSGVPALAGVRTAILGSLWMIGITMLVAFPVGVGAAIYLQEYAADNWLNRLIQTNINNLAGVPSIIYGMLGLAVFVRALEPLTSGAIFGFQEPNGRTVLAAALTMALLILPIIIINAQEAIRAVPGSHRQAAYGLGATRWQTVSRVVLPSAFPGILTGTILAMARAIGETAPLIVVGAATYIVTDPQSPFSQFTALPIQIYNWTTQPQDQFRNIAAAAIIVLLALLLTLNSVAVVLRNRFYDRNQ